MIPLASHFYFIHKKRRLSISLLLQKRMISKCQGSSDMPTNAGPRGPNSADYKKELY